MELLAGGVPIAGVTETLKSKFGSDKIPAAITKYLFCSPNGDFKFRCLPSSGGLYSQRMRDVIEFNIIETRIRSVQERHNARRN